jgi:hypothetical protein
MSDEVPQGPQQFRANLNTLQRQLEEMAGRIKRSGSPERDRRHEFQEPVMIVRGK